MNYYTVWSWMLLYATLVIWFPLAKLLGLGSYTWWAAFALVWVPWLITLVGLGIKWACRQLQAWLPAKGGVL